MVLSCVVGSFPSGVVEQQPRGFTKVSAVGGRRRSVVARRPGTLLLGSFVCIVDFLVSYFVYKF